jgi:hypothetical protein
MSAIGPLSKAKRTSASDCRTIAIYEYTPSHHIAPAIRCTVPVATPNLEAMPYPCDEPARQVVGAGSTDIDCVPLDLATAEGGAVKMFASSWRP